VTLDEFKLIEPQLAYRLSLSFGHCTIDGVYENDGRWEAHLAVPPNGEFEVVYEARCKPHCRRGSGGPWWWVLEDHKCCEACEVDPSHHYETVHE
jgi:hypothetical protein